MIALGTSAGRLEVDPHLGGKFFKIRPVDGFSSQLASATVILGASLVGGPVSHHPGGQFVHHGCGRGGKSEQSPLGSGAGDCHRLAVYHP